MKNNHVSLNPSYPTWWRRGFRVRTAVTQLSLLDNGKPRPDSITFPFRSSDVQFSEASPRAQSKDPVRALGTDFSVFFKG